MASLYKRASPHQAMLLRMIEGAIKNAHDAHKTVMDPYLARSIAKRAAGTISGNWPELLGARPSEKTGKASDLVKRIRSARHSQFDLGAGSLTRIRGHGGGASGTKAPPLRLLDKTMRKAMWHIKESGYQDLALAMIEVMKEIHKLENPSEQAQEAQSREGSTVPLVRADTGADQFYLSASGHSGPCRTQINRGDLHGVGLLGLQSPEEGHASRGMEHVHVEQSRMVEEL